MNILRPWAAIAAVVLVAPAPTVTARQVTIDRNWTAPIEPLRIFENVY